MAAGSGRAAGARLRGAAPAAAAGGAGRERGRAGARKCRGGGGRGSAGNLGCRQASSPLCPPPAPGASPRRPRLRPGIPPHLGRARFQEDGTVRGRGGVWLRRRCTGRRRRGDERQEGGSDHRHHRAGNGGRSPGSRALPAAEGQGEGMGRIRPEAPAGSRDWGRPWERGGGGLGVGLPGAFAPGPRDAFPAWCVPSPVPASLPRWCRQFCAGLELPLTAGSEAHRPPRG